MFKTKKRLSTLLMFIVIFLPLLYAKTEKTPQKKKPIGVYDSLKWKSIRSSVVSNNGEWFGYTLVPNFGESKTIIKNLKTEKTYEYKVGKIKSYSGNNVKFSTDSKWAAFYVYPSKKDKTSEKKLYLINLKTGEKREFKKVKSFKFSGENPNYIAIHRIKEKKGKEKSKSNSSDLILINLKTDEILNFGNVSSYSFNKKGTYLAYLIDTEDGLGNGVSLIYLNSGKIKNLDSSEAKYQSLKWSKEKDYFTVLKGEKSDKYKDKIYTILAFKFFKNSKLPKKYEVNKKEIKDFPEELEISPNFTPYWSEVYNAVIFGIYKPELKEKKEKKKPEKKVKKNEKEEKAKKDKEKKKDKIIKELKLPSLIIWHYKDKRLQSMQWLQASQDKNYSYRCIYHFDTKKFIRLADDNLRKIRISPEYVYAIGYDNSKYELEGNLSGKRYSNIYSINLKTGQKKMILEKVRWSFFPSYDGKFLLFYKNKNFYTVSSENGKIFNLTSKLPTTFVNLEDDHNVKNPPVHQYGFGWFKDNKGLLLTDGWDIWKVDRYGKKFVNITQNGKKEKIKYQYPFILEENFKGFSEKKPLYIKMYGEKTKKNGIARVMLKKSCKKEVLLWGDANYSNLKKAKKANVFLYTFETFKDFPDYYLTDKSFKKAKKITDSNSQQKNYLWSSGRILLNYRNSEGKDLQAALFLPANYEKGKKYPIIVYIYEKLSQSLNRYQMPREFGFSTSRYTSNGYAVLMPDIIYKVNDPGLSSVDCIKAAVKAVINTGIVDEKRMGIHGHSWGGYQTAFIITQTDMFSAAVAGAPLTDLISMYSSIYWNTGSANQPIFESSQGRFKGGYWDYFDSYRRNSPIHNVKRVKTPLLLLHNNKDGAVDWNQGIEYYNTLRRLHKFVIMLEYKGENHGLRKKENRIDYGIRMQEFFDHFLKGKEAPDWMKKGVPYIKLEKYLKERKKIIEKR